MTTFIAGFKAGFGFYGLGFTVGAGLVSAAISISLTLAVGTIGLWLLRR